MDTDGVVLVVSVIVFLLCVGWRIWSEILRSNKKIRELEANAAALIKEKERDADR